MHVQFCQQMLLIRTIPRTEQACKAGEEVCRKDKAKFLLPVPQYRLWLLFCIRKGHSVPISSIDSEVPEFYCWLSRSRSVLT